MNMKLYPKLQDYVQEVCNSTENVPESRKDILIDIADYIRSKADKVSIVKLNFICTHNSRRSHMAAIWAGLAAYYFGLNNIETYSGGTEATAFNPRAVKAMERAGFRTDQTGTLNPEYHLSFTEKQPPFICFSKTYDHPSNPSSGFAAIMTCSDADENCPLIPGTEYRKSLTYTDPKEADDSPQEEQVYNERCFQIAVEMFCLMDLVNKKTS